MARFLPSFSGREGVSMPRKAIKIPDHIEYISVLDEHGRLDTKLMPDLTEDQLRHLHRIMLLSRRFDERLLSLQRQGRIGTFAPAKGSGSGANWGDGPSTAGRLGIAVVSRNCRSYLSQYTAGGPVYFPGGL